jgi:hypothetical protein
VPWTSDELDRVGAAEELRIAPMRSDGTLRRPTTVWVVREGDDLYVRSVDGPESSWFRGTQVRHEGHISAGGVEKDVSFVAAGDDTADGIDSAYGEKYSRYPQSYVDGVTTPQARSTTLRLVPR